jgi:hypothetical protein
MSDDETEEQKKMMMSYVNLGRDRFYWVVGSYESFCDEQEPEHSGYVAHEHEAWKKCFDLQKQLDPDGNIVWIAPLNYRPNIMRMKIPAGWARECHKRKARAKRRSKPASTSPDAAPVDFVFNRLWDFKTMRSTWLPHQVVKKTPKRIFVRQEPHQQDAPPRTEATYSLNRKEFETRGQAWSENYFFFATVPGDSTSETGTNDAELLGIKLPCSKGEVVRAFRQRAKKAHPDAGGESEAFIHLRDAYNRVLNTI